MKIKEFFKLFPNEIYWKLLIDQEYWSKGPHVFDRDESPNYLHNITQAFLFMLSTIEDPISLDFVIGLRDLAFNKKNVEEMGLSKYGISGIDGDLVSEEGLIQLIDRIKCGRINLSIHPVLKQGDKFNKTLTFDLASSTKSSTELAREMLANLKRKIWFNFGLARFNNIQAAVDDVSNLIENFNSNITTATSQEQKLFLIAELIQSIHQYHPFQDGNGRTFIFLLLNKLLLMNNLSPTIIAVPGKFSGHSINQLVNEIIKGQKIFKSLCHEELKKNESFISYLATKTNANDIKDGIEYIRESVLELAEINIEALYSLAIENQNLKQNINQQLNILYEIIIPKKYNPKTIDYILETTPPKDYKILMSALENAAYFGNFYLAKKLIEYSQQEHLYGKIRNLKMLFNISLGGLNDKQVNTLFESFKLTSVEIANFLYSDKFSLGKDKHHVLHNLLIAKRYTQLRDLLEKLEPNDFEELFSQNLKGMNSLQRIALYGDDELLTYCIKRLGSKALGLLNESFVSAELSEFDQRAIISFDAIKIINWYKSLHQSQVLSPSLTEFKDLSQPLEDLKPRKK